MSVGGIVTKIELLDDGNQRIATNERQYPRDTQTCVRVGGEHDIHIGDSLWWQGRSCYWSRDNEFRDVKIDRLGYSHSDPTPEIKPYPVHALEKEQSNG